MELFKGRPADLSDRSEKEIRVYDFLDSLGIEYFRLDHAPAFGSEEELSFAKDLLQWSIELAEENKSMIANALQNWEADRIAYMDQIILMVALTEIRRCNEIALEISMNEYIEIAKEYSSDKSYVFINGVLNRVVNDLKAENQLFKLIKK